MVIQTIPVPRPSRLRPQCPSGGKVGAVVSICTRSTLTPIQPETVEVQFMAEECGRRAVAASAAFRRLAWARSFRAHAARSSPRFDDLRRTAIRLGFEQKPGFRSRSRLVVPCSVSPSAKLSPEMPFSRTLRVSTVVYADETGESGRSSGVPVSSRTWRDRHDPGRFEDSIAGTRVSAPCYRCFSAPCYKSAHRCLRWRQPARGLSLAPRLVKIAARLARSARCWRDQPEPARQREFFVAKICTRFVPTAIRNIAIARPLLRTSRPPTIPPNKTFAWWSTQDLRRLTAKGAQAAVDPHERPYCRHKGIRVIDTRQSFVLPTTPPSHWSTRR